MTEKPYVKEVPADLAKRLANARARMEKKPAGPMPPLAGCREDEENAAAVVESQTPGRRGARG